ncbi:MAG: hypothetical protein OXI83_04110 [Gemmatimonadota bacterium]|nr:hypothetical protein [Gemmatimonadota bacterium]
MQRRRGPRHPAVELTEARPGRHNLVSRLKLSSVISDVLGASGRRILEAVVSGEEDPDRLAALGGERLACSGRNCAQRHFPEPDLPVGYEPVQIDPGPDWVPVRPVAVPVSDVPPGPQPRNVLQHLHDLSGGAVDPCDWGLCV